VVGICIDIFHHWGLSPLCLNKQSPIDFGANSTDALPDRKLEKGLGKGKSSSNIPWVGIF